MYIKLTRLDNSPIWINAAFVVTVEPRKGGGTIVVPIGDGLDYEVREKTESVLAMLDGAPAAAVVPVPPPKGLAPTPEDVSPETEPPDVAPVAAPVVAAEAAPSEPAPADASAAGEEPKPAKRTRRTKKVEADGAEPKPARKPRAKAKKPAAEFPEEQVERLKKMMPGSMRKLLNTLATQFKVADAEPVVELLQSRGIIDVDRDHIVWKS